MKRRRNKLLSNFLLLLVFIGFSVPHYHFAYSTELSHGFTITIDAPEDYQEQDTVNVTITIVDENNTGFQKAEVKLGESGKWQDITSILKEQQTGVYRIVAGVKNNGIIYVSVTDNEGNSYTENKTIHCFDDSPSILHVSVNGKRLFVNVENSHSGIKAIYIGNHSFTDIENNCLELDIQDYISDSQKTISVYAVDNAGNKSKTTTIDNPFYEYENGNHSSANNSSNNSNSDNITHDTTDSIETTDNTVDSSFHNADTLITVPPGNATKKPEETKTAIDEKKENTEQSPSQQENIATQIQPSTPATNTQPQTPIPQNQTTQPTTQQVPNITINMPSIPVASTTSTPMVTQPTQTAEKIQETQAVTPNGSVTPIDGTGTVIENSVQTSATREFFTIQTEQGNIFYIVVDKQKQQNNVYLLSSVTESDLLGLIGEKENTSAIEKTKEEEKQELPKILLPKPTEKPDTTPQPQPEESEKPKKKSPVMSVLLLILFIGIASCAAYYFKIYRPKQILDEDEEDYFDESEGTSQEPDNEDECIEEETNTDYILEDSESHLINLSKNENKVLDDDIENGLTDDDYYD